MSDWTNKMITSEQLPNISVWRSQYLETYLPNPSGRTFALGSTQPLTEMNTRNLKKRNLAVKCGRRVGLTTLPPSVSRLSK
jgi:hypothetical protein